MKSLWVTLVVVASLSPMGAWALPSTVAPSSKILGESRPGNPNQDIDITERLGNQIPLDLSFTDSEGKSVKLLDYVGKDQKPLILTLVYYRCPTLCNLVLSGIGTSMRDSGLVIGDDFRTLTVSIDPKETTQQAAQRRRGHLSTFTKQIPSSDWPFLVGSEESITKLADSVGFKFAYDEETMQFAHAAVVMILTPEGKVSRYLYGMQFSPKDLKLALLEASGGRVGTSFDRVLLTCYRYDPAERRYGFYMMGFLKVGAFAVFAGLAAVLGVLWRREIKRGTLR